MPIFVTLQQINVDLVSSNVEHRNVVGRFHNYLTRTQWLGLALSGSANDNSIIHRLTYKRTVRVVKISRILERNWKYVLSLKDFSRKYEG